MYSIQQAGFHFRFRLTPERRLNRETHRCDNGAMWKWAVIVLVSAPWLVSAAAGGQARFPCADDSAVRGSCVTRRGRLYVTQGIPLRIWMIGTRRTLAVATSEHAKNGFMIPASILRLVDLETNVYADFDVCFLRSGRSDANAIDWNTPGIMPEVCVAAGRRFVRERSTPNGVRSWRIPDPKE
jgi:hypothetical protein